MTDRNARSRRAAAWIGALAASALALAPTALANPGRTVFADAGPGGSALAASASGHQRHPNRAFAGYLTTAGATATVRVRLTVPSFTCTRSERAISPGAFLLSGPTDHEYFNAANIILGCYRGKRVTEEALVVNNRERNSTRTLHTGDSVIVRVSDNPSGAMKVQVKDITEHHRFTVRLSGRGAAAQAELVGDWASVDTSTQLPLTPPRFAPTTFAAGRVSGRPLGSLRPTGFDMAGGRGRLQIAAGRLFGAPRDSFTCTRR
jgi:hypothetical protein